MQLKNWFRKEPKEPIATPTMEEQSWEELCKARVAKLDPNCKYLFMWDRALTPAHWQCIRRNLAELLGGEHKVAMWGGMPFPEIYEFKKDEEEKASA